MTGFGLRSLITGSCAVILAACGTTQPYDLNIVPTILTPASKAGVVDERARFRKIYCAVSDDHGADFPYHRPCSQALHRLGDEAAPDSAPVSLGQPRSRLRFVVVPGIFGECADGMARPFEDAIEPMQKLGWSVVPLKISGRSSSAENAREIRAQLAANPLLPDERLVLIGYSKGISDILELLATDTSAIIPPGSAVISIAGVVAGTPIADGAEKFYARFWWVPLPGCRPGDGGGVASLTRRHRLNFLARHSFRSDLEYYSLPAFTTADNISSYLRPAHAALSRVDPRNDGNVLFHDAVLPGSTLLGYANSDHWALTLPFSLQAPFRAKFFATRNEYPRVILLEAIGRFLDEDFQRQRTLSSLN